jgi:hypothetical protein
VRDEGPTSTSSRSDLSHLVTPFHHPPSTYHIYTMILRYPTFLKYVLRSSPRPNPSLSGEYNKLITGNTLPLPSSSSVSFQHLQNGKGYTPVDKTSPLLSEQTISRNQPMISFAGLLGNASLVRQTRCVVCLSVSLSLFYPSPRARGQSCFQAHTPSLNPSTGASSRAKMR